MPTTNTKILTTPKHVYVPPGADQRPALAEPLADYTRKADAHRLAVTELRDAEGKAATAQKQARAALADSLAAGEDATAAAPETAAVDAAREKVLALYEATQEAARAVFRAFKRDREDWRNELTAEREKAEQKLAKKLDEALALVGEVEGQTDAIRVLHPDLEGRRLAAKIAPPHFSERPKVMLSLPAEAGEVIAAARSWLDAPYEGEDVTFLASGQQAGRRHSG